MSQEFQDSVLALAEEIAETDFSKEFHDLPKDLQHRVWRLAETRFVDGQADRFEEAS